MDFSVIIPAKNEQKYLGLCLQSLSQLDYPREAYEVLVIDNGSTDKTVEIAQQYGAQVFVRPELTIAGLRNLGASHAQGRFLVFLDADCTVVSDWFTAASGWLEQADVCCFGGPPEVPEEGTWVQHTWFMVRGKHHLVEDVEWLESMNMFVRKEIFDRVHGFDETLTTCEDYDLSLRLRPYGRIVADKRIRAVHHGEAATLGHFFRKECWRGVSNISGLIRHGFRLRELPSLFAPVAFLLCLVVTIVALAVSVAKGGWPAICFFVVFLLGWQAPIFLLAMLKGKTSPSCQQRLGLYLLLNVYFMARGVALLRGWRR
ncbi:MAG: glycosyltransferase [Proteobacteria bacterium]|nr:glycosyltransferase [Pseudomonadota bacterium]